MSVWSHESTEPMAFFADWPTVGRNSDGWVGFADPERTCLERAAEPYDWTDNYAHDTTGVRKSVEHHNSGLCRLSKGHEGDHADDVWTCDACDNTYPEEGKVEKFGNADVTICGRCSPC